MLKNKLIKIINNKFFQGGFFLTASNFLVGFLNYLFSSLSAKTLGPAKYSEIVAVFAYLWILAVPTQVISSDLIRRLGSKGKERYHNLKIWEQWFYKKILYWWWLLIPYFASCIIVSKLTNLSILYSVVLLIVFLTSFLSVFYTSSLLGLHLFLSYSLVIILVTLIKLIGPILVYFRLDSLFTIAFFIVLSSIALIILGKIFLNKALKNIFTKKKSDKRIKTYFLSKSIIILSLSLVGMNLLNNLDVIYAKKNFSAYEAGVYGAWSLFGKFIFYVLSPILSIGYIFFTTKEEGKWHKKTLVVFLAILLALGIVLYLIYSFFGKYLVLLIFNQNYIKILPYLPQAAIFGIFFTIISFINGFFVAKNSNKALIITFCIFVYVIGLFIYAKSIFSLIKINVVFSIAIALIYFVFSFLKRTQIKS